MLLLNILCVSVALVLTVSSLYDVWELNNLTYHNDILAHLPRGTHACDAAQMLPETKLYLLDFLLFSGGMLPQQTAPYIYMH